MKPGLFQNLNGKIVRTGRNATRKLRYYSRLLRYNVESSRIRRIEPGRCIPKGTEEWLMHKELVYGGLQTNVPRGRVSSHDPIAQHPNSTTQGGDRMIFNRYARCYSEFLGRFDFDAPLIIAEFGILNGTGLAIWCDLFPKARVLGFDIDIGRFLSNKADLEKLGAFKDNQPEAYEYDQFEQNSEFLRKTLQGDKIDVVIDDGCHIDEAILLTMESVMPYLCMDFVYFVEDNRRVHERIRHEYPKLVVSSFGRLTVVQAS